MDIAALKKSIDDNSQEVAGLVKDVKWACTELERLGIARQDSGNRRLLPGLGGNNDNNPEVREALAKEWNAIAKFARTGDESEMRSVSGSSEGGYVVYPQVSAVMTKRLFDMSPMRRLARIETMTTGDSWEEPADLEQTSATWVREEETRPETATPQPGRLVVPVCEIYALQPLTQNLIDDAYIDVGAWIEGKISDKFARAEGMAFVTGDGVKKPKGFMSLLTTTDDDFTRDKEKLQHVITGNATVVTADSLRDIYWKLRAVHRGNATWMMSSDTANSIDKLKDGNGDYLWRNGMTAGSPPSLLGRPVEFAEDMAAIGAGTYPIAFGDFKAGYLIVDKAGMRLLRDPYSSKPYVLFYAYRRVGGNVALPDAIKVLKVTT